MTDQTQTGGCLCGRIRYTATGPLRAAVACHCKQCQRTTGNFVAATSVPRPMLSIDGAPKWFQSSPEARRAFCPDCGSNLFWDGGGDRVSIMMGTLDGPTGIALEGHIFCAYKGDWFEIADGLPQYPEDDAVMTTQVP